MKEVFVTTMHPLWVGFYLTAGVALFVGLAHILQDLLNGIAKLLSDWKRARKAAKNTTPPRTAFCPTCSWSLTPVADDVTITHQDDGTHQIGGTVCALWHTWSEVPKEAENGTLYVECTMCEARANYYDVADPPSGAVAKP